MKYLLMRIIRITLSSWSSAFATESPKTTSQKLLAKAAPASMNCKTKCWSAEAAAPAPTTRTSISTNRLEPAAASTQRWPGKCNGHGVCDGWLHLLLLALQPTHVGHQPTDRNQCRLLQSKLQIRSGTDACAAANSLAPTMKSKSNMAVPFTDCD